LFVVFRHLIALTAPILLQLNPSFSIANQGLRQADRPAGIG